MHASFVLFSCLLAISLASKVGPYRGLRSSDTPHFQDPSCVEFTLQVNRWNKFSRNYFLFYFCLSNISQDNLPAGTVQLITYGAPEISFILAMGLSGYLTVFHQLNTQFNWRRHENISTEWPESDSPLRSLPCKITVLILFLSNFDMSRTPVSSSSPPELSEYRSPSRWVLKRSSQDSKKVFQIPDCKWHHLCVSRSGSDVPGSESLPHPLLWHGLWGPGNPWWGHPTRRHAHFWPRDYCNWIILLLNDWSYNKTFQLLVHFPVFIDFPNQYQ